METSNKLTGKQLSLWTSSAADTPANHSAPQANDEAQTTLDTSGHGSETPLAHYDPDTQSWKTSGDISLWGEQPSLESLPKSGMTRNGVLYQQPDWVRPIDVTASSLWPTPTAVTRPMEGNVRMYRAKIEAGEMTEAEAAAILGKSVWEAQGKVPTVWPTPTVDDAKNVNPKPNRRPGLVSAVNNAKWPTPLAQGGGGSGHWNKVEKMYLDGQITYEEKMALQAGRGGKLNPMWVEWLMGFPIGWTDLED